LTITLRPAGPADALLIADHRDAMFAEDKIHAATIRQASAMYRDWLAGALATDAYMGWLAEESDQVIGSIGLWLIPWPHHPKHPGTNLRGYVTNMWVDAAHRRKGAGRLLVEAATAEAKARGVTWMMLHATEAGRPLYESMGWRAGNEMVLKLG
jgi:GNAT superfamily N-acetyltransferase